MEIETGIEQILLNINNISSVRLPTGAMTCNISKVLWNSE
jgi:hypothetical protein